MAEARSRSLSRSAALTRDRIVDAAIELLDAGGESGLTFRSLARKLETGHGAIQWHIANKEQLFAAAGDKALAEAIGAPVPESPPRSAVRTVALGVFAAIDAHPWLGAWLVSAPSQPAMVALWERIGRAVEELGVPEDSLFTAASTLVSYIVGVAGQNAANTQFLAGRTDRTDFLSAVADHWESLDQKEHPFVNRVAGRLRAHDDRVEFLAGIDIILAGLAAQPTG